jgi:signal transduction histidine kinase
MPDTGTLAEILLEQSTGCYCVVRASRLKVRRSKGPAVYGEIAFEKVWGNSFPLFGKPNAELTGANCVAVLTEERARAWCSRFERGFDGDQLLLRERCGDSVWYMAVFPLQVDDEFCYAACAGREITPWGTAEQELRHTVLGALKAQEFERTMMARFLHDSVGQNLTALGLQLDLIRMDLATAAPAAGERVAEVQKVLGEMMESVREYSYELHPATVERAGLRAALDRLAVRSRERFSGILRVNVDPSMKIEPKLASAFYQIAQEAIENAAQHSGASAIDVTVKAARSGVSMEVRDNGRGFDPDDILGSHRGLGLLSMEHYAAQAGLELSIASTRESGTIVRAFTG